MTTTNSYLSNISDLTTTTSDPPPLFPTWHQQLEYELNKRYELNPPKIINRKIIRTRSTRPKTVNFIERTVAKNYDALTTNEHKISSLKGRSGKPNGLSNYSNCTKPSHYTKSIILKSRVYTYMRALFNIKDEEVTAFRLNTAAYNELETAMLLLMEKTLIHANYSMEKNNRKYRMTLEDIQYGLKKLRVSHLLR